MASKQYPKLDVWAHMGARYGGRSASEPQIDVEEALALTIASEGKQPTPHEKATFRTAFYQGIVNYKVWRLQDLMRYMNREQVIALSEDMTALYAKYRVAVGLPPEDTDDSD